MRYLTTKQVADQMGVTPATVRVWIQTRGLRAQYIGGGDRPKIRISEADLQAWVEDPSKILIPVA